MTGWARVEAGAHFPSDTMVGGVIGDFFADFFTQAFLVPTDRLHLQLRVMQLPDGVMLRIQANL